jgi:tetratricopeptide (TPR) repeat protein
MGDLYRLSGLYPAALTSYEAAAASCPESHLPWIEHKLGSVHNQLGNYELAECHLQAAFEELESAPDGAAAAAEHAMVTADWSYTVYRRGDAPRALQHALQATRLATSCQDEGAMAQAYNNLGMLERATGELDLALQHLQDSLGLAEKLGDPGSRAAALNNLARVYAELGQVDPAIHLTQQALELCEQRGDRHRAAALLNNLADLFHAAGREAEAMDHLRRAVVIFAELGIDPSGAAMLPEVWKLSEW